MKSLNNVQIVFKIGKILSKIAFIAWLVGACICAVGLVILPFGVDEILKIGGVTLHGLMGLDNGEANAAAIAVMVGWLIICVGITVVAKFAERYFTNELKAGTPFTEDGAKELMRLGILTAAVPLGCNIVAEIIVGVVTGIFGIAESAVTDIAYDCSTAIMLGAMFIVVSLLCRYGAEIGKKDAEE